jgi:DNA-binding protein Fis
VRYATLKAIPTHGIDLPQMVDGYERGLIETALRQTNGNQTKAAQLLGLRVQTLNMKLKRFAEQNQEINIH